MDLGARLEKLLGAEPPEADRLQELERLLARFGQALDLVGFDTEEERDRRYFAEALRALSWLPERGRALDIGSGGGSPALPLAIARREVSWTLVEANAKKAMFLDEAVRALGLESAAVVHQRYEGFQARERFDTVTVRGVALTKKMLHKATSEIVAGGRLLWFSSEARISEAGEGLEGGLRREAGPVQLIAGGGFLGVFERLG